MDIISPIIAALMIFLLYGGGLIAALILLIITSRNNSLIRRIYLVGAAFFLLASQHSCYYLANNFISASGGNTFYFIFIYFIAAAWSLFLLRKLNIVNVLRNQVQLLTYNIKCILIKTYLYSLNMTKSLIKANNKRYKQMLSREINSNSTSNNHNIKELDND